MTHLPEPTREEAKNGWTSEALAEHLAQTQQAEYAAMMSRLFPEKPPLKIEPVASFDPHHW
jgi:hypothetical protein